MIRKFLVGALLSASLVVGHAATFSLTVVPATFTNLLPFINGSVKVTSFTITAPTATAANATFVDSANGSLAYTNSAYTNTIRYATNNVISWTDFYGVARSVTNMQLIDVTNNYVAPSTNAWPVRFVAAVAGSTSSTYNGVNYYFNDGIWVTNTASGNAIVTITYQQ